MQKAFAHTLDKRRVKNRIESFDNQKSQLSYQKPKTKNALYRIRRSNKDLIENSFTPEVEDREEFKRMSMLSIGSGTQFRGSIHQEIDMFKNELMSSKASLLEVPQFKLPILNDDEAPVKVVITPEVLLND